MTYGVGIRRRRRHRGELVAKKLLLSSYNVSASATVSTVVGHITNSIGTVTLTDTASGKFSLSSGNIVVAAALTATTYNITLKEVQSNGVTQYTAVTITGV